jgi:hypothetical protein
MSKLVQHEDLGILSICLEAAFSRNEVVSTRCVQHITLAGLS